MGTTAGNMENAGRLTTHVLDTMHGKPAAGLAVSLFRIDGEDRELVLSARTNADGRCDAPLLSLRTDRDWIADVVRFVARRRRGALAGR